MLRFYSGDSYIVLNTYKKAGGCGLAWNAHFWIGDYSSQDEYGTAAYKTVWQLPSTTPYHGHISLPHCHMRAASDLVLFPSMLAPLVVLLP